MRILVTGSKGFIGSNLKLDGHETMGFDIKDSLEYDITNPYSVQAFWAEKRPDVVVHLAANPRVGLSQKYPCWDNRINVEGTINVLEASLKNDVKLFIYASTCQVYDVKGGIPMLESSPRYPRTPYAISKYAGEFYCKNFERRGLNTCILRFFNVYGHGQSAGYVIPDLIGRVSRARRRVKVYGPPDDSRDFIHVMDVAKAIRKVIECEHEVPGEIINIGTGLEIDMKHLCERMAEAFGKDLEFEYGERPFGMLPGRYQADITKAITLLDWTPKVTLEDGIKLTVSGEKENG